MYLERNSFEESPGSQMYDFQPNLSRLSGNTPKKKKKNKMNKKKKWVKEERGDSYCPSERMLNVLQINQAKMQQKPEFTNTFLRNPQFWYHIFSQRS